MLTAWLTIFAYQEPPTAQEILVTPSARPHAALEEPWSAESLDGPRIQALHRTLTDALRGLPSVMVQKTAHGQASPYLRGFTGYRSLMLVDGVRLNHAAMRDGPNQYWSTVDAFTVERLEVVRGPSSVLYGSDAIGGTVNAVGRAAEFAAPGTELDFGGRLSARLASAENSAVSRAEARAAGADWGARGGLTIGDFGDLEAGSGSLPETGYEEINADFRFDQLLAEDLRLTLAAQTVRQTDVPRTHSTIFAVPFHGSSVGSELQRDLDQTRDLAYGRLAWENRGGAADAGVLTLSWQRHAETQDRLRSGDRRDLRGFDLDDLGAQARFNSEATASGTWSWGAEAHLQKADSFRHDFLAGAFTGSSIQGPIGDDSTVADLAAYVQDEIVLERVTLIPGLRLSWYDLESDRVENPAPGPPVIGVSNDWFAATGSFRAVVPLGDEAAAYAGVSQGFRAPSLSDLTAFDSTSVVESPAPDLDSEQYLQFEIGSKGRRGPVAWQAALYRTQIEDMILRTPTGILIGGLPEVVKSNAGDGWIHGVELSASWAIAEQWSVFLSGAWMDGEVDEEDPASPTTTTRQPVSRLAPLQAYGGVRWSDAGGKRWIEGWAWAAERQDELSPRDQVDTSRIPPGGTPGFAVFGITAGMELAEDVDLIAALENIGDKDYRIHGSGVNQPGRNLILAVDFWF